MKKLNALCFLLLLVSAAKAQTVTASAGGSGTLGGMQISYTAGEAVIATVEGSNAVLTQGFHQPSYTFTAIRETFPPGSVTVFPNPTAAYLNVQFKDLEIKNIRLLLFDVAGRRVHTAFAKTTDTWQIDLSPLASGYYILVVTDQVKNKFNSFKILKSN